MQVLIIHIILKYLRQLEWIEEKTKIVQNRSSPMSGCIREACFKIYIPKFLYIVQLHYFFSIPLIFSILETNNPLLNQNNAILPYIYFQLVDLTL